MLSYHAILADKAMLDTAKLATDIICAACGEDNPELSVVVHGIPVVVCDAACEANLIELWAPKPLHSSASTFGYWFRRIMGEY